MLADTEPTERENTSDAGQKSGGKVRLLSLNDLDGRTKAVQNIQGTRQAVIADLGGEEQLSTLERVACDHVAILDAMTKDAAARWLTGKEVDVSVIATLINAFNRSAAIIGWNRRARDIGPDLSNYLNIGAAS